MSAVRQTRSHLMKLFEQHGFRPRGDLGQNFLIDLNLLEFIVQEAQLQPADVVLEIGSGTGGMTTFLAQQAAHVISVEYDVNMFALASEQTAGLPNLTLINADALHSKHRFNPQVIEAIERQLAVDPLRRLKLVANLPYSIGTPVMSNLVASELPWTMMVCTIQLELAERMAAGVERSNYGALTVWMQAQCHIEILRRLPPTVFWPRPQVDSAILKVTPDPALRERMGDREFFHDFLRRVFTQRRKRLRPVLNAIYGQQLTKPEIDAILSAEGLHESARAEELTVSQLVSLSNRLQNAILRRDEGN